MITTIVFYNDVADPPEHLFNTMLLARMVQY